MLHAGRGICYTCGVETGRQRRFRRACALACAALACAALHGAPETPEDLWRTAWSKDELLCDWLAQDIGLAPGEPIERGGVAARLAKALARHGLAKGTNETWSAAVGRYRAACVKRRAARLHVLAGTRWVYCRHYVMGGSHYAYTEALSDAQSERTYLPIGSSLCLAEATPDGFWRETVLIESKDGCFRDADVSPDGTRILYSFKASDRGDDFHLYEMAMPSRAVRQLTSGKGAADYEGCYLPDGRILFNSTRCMQIVDCWWTEVSNLYRCEADGSGIRRITFDQVHDNYPTLAPDGRVFYTRWEYNDRSQMYPQPLFAMNADGTGQRAVYGGNSWFPTTLIHARAVPGSPLFFGVATGHHSLQPGELMRFDPRKGREEASGAEQLEPLRPAKAARIDAYGQHGRVAAYPWPLDERQVVLAYLPQGYPRGKDGRAHVRDHRAPFGLYWLDVDGARELLVAQRGKVPCGRPVALAPRAVAPRPSVRPDETLKTGVVAIQDVYTGAAMAGVLRGTVKSLRAVSIDYRPVGIGQNANGGPGGGGLSCTPPAIGQGTWGVKRVLGEVSVAADGSVAFEAPACTPMYFQLLDAKGRLVQSMRSWTVLQPGETASCLGCHESANQAPSAAAHLPSAKVVRGRMAVPPRGLSFPKDVQPILARRCVSCHNPQANPKIPDLTDAPVADEQSKRTWTRAYVSLTHARPRDKHWSGAPDHKVLNWISTGSVPTPHAPRTRGSGASALFAKLDAGHAPGLTEEEKRLLACWTDLGVPFCGDYEEGAAWSDADRARWETCRRKRTAFLTPSDR